MATRPLHIDDIVELSPAQQGIFYEALSSAKTGKYVEQICLWLDDDVDAAVLRETWRQVYASVPTLRSTFLLQNVDRPMQVVRGRTDEPWVEHHWTDLPVEEQRRRLDAFLQADRGQSFDLSKGPLVRVALLETGVAGRVLVWTHHHLLLDGWSVSLLVRLLADTYAALRRDGHARIPPSFGQRDYLLWLQAQDQRGKQDYWRDAFAGFVPLPPMRLSTNGAATDAEYGACESRWSSAQTAALMDVARARHVTVNGLLQAGWALTLSRVTDRTDVTFGITVSGRSPELPTFDTLIGMFITSVPLRTVIDPAVTVASWLERLDRQNVALLPFAHVSPLQIQQWTNLPARVPLFETLLVYENYPVETRAANDALHVRDVEFAGGRTHYPLVLLAVPGPSMRLRLIHQPALVDAGAARAMLEMFETVLDEIAANPSCAIGALPAWSRPAPVHTVDARDETAVSYAPAQPPRTPTEKQLAPIWTEVLGVPHANVHEDFFELGGHSLLAMQLLSRIREHFGIELTIVDLFDMTLTLEALAQLIDRGVAGVPSSGQATG